MEETTLKQILDVVVDIKTEQKSMKEEMNNIKEKVGNMEGKIGNMEGKIGNMEGKIDKIAAEQLVIKETMHKLKTDTQILNFNVNRLIREQEDTKLIVSTSVQKIRRSKR